MSGYFSPQIIQEIQDLRKQGLSLTEISSKMHIAKSSVSRYVNGIDLNSLHKNRLLAKKKNASKIRKERKEAEARELALKEFSSISNREKMLFISALYWAEGSKKDFGLSNTDPSLIKVFVNGLRLVYGVTNDRLRVSIRIYEDMDKNTCLQFWSRIVKIPKEKFVNVDILKGKKSGKLQYGMCRVRVTKGEGLLKQIKAVNTVIAEKVAPVV